SSASAIAITASCARSGSAEVHLRHLFRRRRRVEERIFLEPEEAGGDVRRELAARRVVVLHALVVAHALDRDAVLGPGELVHQAVEALARPQLRVVFDDDQRSAECGALLVGGLDGLLGGLRAGHLRARIGNLPEHVLLLLRDPLRGLDEIRDEIVPALQLVFDLRPLRLDAFFLADEGVVRASRRRAGGGDDERQHEQIPNPKSQGPNPKHRGLLEFEIWDLGFGICHHGHRLPPRAGATTAAAAAAEPAEAAAESAAATATPASAAAAAEGTDSAVPAAPGPHAPAAEAPAPSRAPERVQHDEEDEEREDDVAAGADVRRAVRLRTDALQRDVASLRDARGHARHTGEQAWSVVAAPELGRHVLSQRLAGEPVGDELLQVVPDFDRRLAIVDGGDDEHAVVLAALPDAAAVILEHLHGVLTNVGVRLVSGHRRDDDDVAARLLQRSNQRLHRLLALRV